MENIDEYQRIMNEDKELKVATEKIDIQLIMEENGLTEEKSNY